jgi:hypothetical protein
MKKLENYNNSYDFISSFSFQVPFMIYIATKFDCLSLYDIYYIATKFDCEMLS